MTTPARTPQATTTRPIAATRVIALMNQKGGVGKTTTTVNLAASWAKAGRETLVIDLDPQAHATLHLGVDPKSVERSIYDLLIGDEPDITSIATSTRPHLSVLPAHTDLAAAESELARLPDRQKRLDAAITRAA
jgi:chromosome partitioning protein